jgi:hypothetical protein
LRKFDLLAHDLDARFRARRAAGIVSVESLSTLVRECVQAFARNPRDSNRILGSKMLRKRGGQPGNRNRRIHGYYSGEARHLRDGVRAIEWLKRELGSDREGHS